jgi:uncharacterized protein DUF5916/cellulose/xylan binding protein with CBM9 domain
MKYISNKYILTLILILFSYDAIAQTSEPSICHPLKIENEIEVDGVLDEECWSEAQIITNFAQRELFNGAPPTEKTQCAVVYTEEIIYIAFWCYDSEPDKIVAKEMKRDFTYWVDDNFEIIFDTFHDKQNGYVFVVNPNGAMADVQVGRDGSEFNKDWNTIWDAEVVRNDQGWFGEIAIPFSSLKFQKKAIQNWGINFERNIRRKQEQLFWQGWSIDYDFEHVSHAGTLQGLENIRGSELVELKPYVLGGLQYNTDESVDDITKIGGDANILITPRLKLQFTANTDFAQVESDRVQINLSRFAITYPEKRNFFLEGKDFFEYEINNDSRVFYSRKIGYGRDSTGDNVEVPLLGGVRLIGTSGRTNIGVMSIATDSKDDIPSAVNSIIRIRQNILEKSSVGMILTSQATDAKPNTVYGLDFNYKTSDVFENKNLQVNGMFSQSFSEGEDSRNSAYYVNVVYPNDDISGSAGFARVQERFNPELGLMRRNNYYKYSSKLELMPRFEELSWLKKFDFELFDFDVFYTDNTNELESYDISVRPFGIITNSGDNYYANFIHNYDRVDVGFNLHSTDQGTIRIDSGQYWFNRYNIGVSTFRGRRLALNSNVTYGDYYSGKLLNVYNELYLNLNAHVNLYFDYKLNYGEFDDMSFTSNNIGGRVEYSFSPKLLTSIFTQWLPNDDKVLLNVRLKWEPMPGSFLYLAYNQFVNRIQLEVGEVAPQASLQAKFVWRIGV